MAIKKRLPPDRPSEEATSTAHSAPGAPSPPLPSPSLQKLKNDRAQIASAIPAEPPPPEVINEVAATTSHPEREEPVASPQDSSASDPTFRRQALNYLLLALGGISVLIFLEIYWIPVNRILSGWGLLAVFVMLGTAIPRKFFRSFFDELIRRFEGEMRRRQVTPYLLVGVPLLIAALFDSYLHRHFTLLQIVPTKGPYGLLNGSSETTGFALSVSTKGRRSKEKLQRISGLVRMYAGAPERYVHWRVERLGAGDPVLKRVLEQFGKDIKQADDSEVEFRRHLQDIAISGEDADNVINAWEGVENELKITIPPQFVDTERIVAGSTVVMKLWCGRELLLAEEVPVKGRSQILFLGESVANDDKKLKDLDKNATMVCLR